MTINTKLTTGEYFAQVYRLKLLNQEAKPTFSMVLFTKGELIAINIPADDAFGIYETLALLNHIVDDFNLLYDTSAVPSLLGDVFPPMDKFHGYKNLSGWMEALEAHLKEFEAVLQINLTDNKREPLEYIGMSKTAV